MQAKSEQWQADGGKFIPYPATWLNRQGWLDELPAAQAGEDGLPPFVPPDPAAVDARREEGKAIQARLDADAARVAERKAFLRSQIPQLRIATG